MAQISRPYQIALAVLALFGLVWVFALRPHSTNSSSSTVPTATVQSAPVKPAATSPAAKGSSPIYHGSAPGVQGLTRAIAKAHGAVATSEQNAKQLAERSAQAANANAGPTTSSTTSTTTSPAAHAATGAVAPAKSHVVTKSAPVVTHPAPRTGIKAQSGSGRTPARQALVERALNENKVAVILFWNKKGADDRAVQFELRVLEAVHHNIAPVAHTPKVRHELELSGLELQKKIATFEATPGQVASFGSITRGVQVYSTPTILIIAKGGRTTVITGLTDAYSIEQAIDETRHS